jgi:Calponin homology (CH) domain
VNSHLRKVGANIEEIGTDFSDGIRLAQLLQVIAGDNVEKLNKKPTMRIHKIQNTGQCLKFIVDKGVKLVGIAPEGELGFSKLYILFVTFFNLIRPMDIISPPRRTRRWKS